MTVAGNLIKLQIGEHSFTPIEVTHQKDEIDITSSNDGGVPTFLPGSEFVDCVCEFTPDNFRNLQGLLHGVRKVQLRAGGIRIDRTGWVSHVDYIAGFDGASIGFQAVLDPLPEINSWWWTQASPHERADVVYLGVAMDWHLEHGEDAIAGQFRERIQRLKAA